MKRITVLALLSLAAVLHGEARESLDLTGNDWELGNADTLDLSAMPTTTRWRGNVRVPTTEYNVQSIDSSPYPPGYPATAFFEADGKTPKVKQNLSAWLRKKIELPASMLNERSVFLHLGNVAFRSAVWVNGSKASECIQATLPQDIDITRFVHPGENELVIAYTAREGLVDVKNRCYLAPNAGTGAGIHQTARLDFLPTMFIRDVFVKTDLSKDALSFELEIVNGGVVSETVTPRIRIRSQSAPSGVLATFTGDRVTVPLGTAVVTRLRGNWKAPVLWDLNSPVLYDAEALLLQDENCVDVTTQSFGVRTFAVRDRDFLLNGRKITLLRGSTLDPIDDPTLVPPWMGMDRKLNANRLHLGFCNPQHLRIADRQGYLVVPESAWWHVDAYPEETAAVWLPGVKAYFNGWIKTLRNHPSVVIWSLANETFWGQTGDAKMKIAAEIVNTVREADDSRPLQGDGEVSWKGQLDIINIHYPENEAGEISAKFPSAGLNMPNDTWFLRQQGEIATWRARFVWDRPLIVGESFCNGLDQKEEYSSFMGDSVFDGEKWLKQRLTGLGAGNVDDHMDNLFTETIKKYVTEYRAVGVAGINVWTGEQADFMPPQQVRPLDFHPNADAGKLFKRRIVMLNDGDTVLTHLYATLTVNHAIMWSQEITLDLKPGEKQEVELEVEMPETLGPEEGTLLVVLNRYWPYEVSRFSQTVHIIPEFDLSEFKGDIAVMGGIDPEVALLYKLQGLHDEITEKTKLVIVSQDSLDRQAEKQLSAFAEQGGCVLVLPMPLWRPFRQELPERDKDHAATQAWLRAPSHPMLGAMKAEQFSFWKPDNLVSTGTFRKPTTGAFELPLDCGGRFGMAWTPLVEIPVGKGAFILTTFDLEKAALADPGARQLLANLIRYGCTRPNREEAPLNILPHQNPQLKDALAMTRINGEVGVGKRGPVLVDASATIDASVLGELKGALRDGRVVWLHGFSPDTAGKLQGLFDFPLVLAPKPADNPGAIVTAVDALTQGVANFDLFWYRGTLIGRKTPPTPTAEIGRWFLKSPHAKPLTCPAYLSEIKVGEGTVLFDTLRWEHALGAETDKALRIASLLMHNAGASFQAQETARYKRFQVDLKDAANMGFYDPVADDGAGGWTDQGRNDMRFFMINHTGKAGGEDSGMDEPVPAIPETIVLNNVPYRLLDPERNGGKSVVSLGSDTFGTKLPRRANGVKIGAKAEILCFLHAAAWAGIPDGTPIAEVVVHYEDGTSAVIPIRAGMEVGDWHSPKPLGGASVAWTGHNHISKHIGLWSFPWKNPWPEKTMVSLDVCGGLSQAQYVLVALTGSVKRDESEAVIAEWNFEKEEYASSLQSVGRRPERLESGFKTGRDSFFRVPLDTTPFPAAMSSAPYSVSVEFTPTAAPDAPLSGLIQVGTYLKNGFRILLAQDLRVHVAVYSDAGVYTLNSATPVDMNRRNLVEISFDGLKAVLSVNGKIAKIQKGTYPGPCSNPAIVGAADGLNYHFNGVIHDIQIKE